METEHNIALEEIYIPSKQAKDTYLCEDFIVYPEGKETHGGYLLGIIELRATPAAEAEKVTQAIINNLKDHYYNQVNASPEPQKLNLETVFEYALQKTNSAIVEMVQIGHINLALENLHYVIAVAKPNFPAKKIDFIIAQQGLLQIYLLHKTKQNNYKAINIIENTTPKFKEAESDKLKIFSSTIPGEFFHHDALYFCSEIFNNYIPPHKVNKIITANDLGTAIDYFKNLINNVRNNSYLTYCAIFVKMEEKRSAGAEPISQKSINQLISVTEKTEKYLTPAFAINFFGYLREALRFLRTTFKRKDKIQGVKASAEKFSLLKKLLNLIRAIFYGCFKLANKIIGKIKHERPSVGTPKGEKAENKNNRKKIAVAAIVILSLIIGGSVFSIKYNQKAKAEAEAYSVQLKNIKDLISNAQVSLIYKNEAESLALIKKAEDLLKNLPQKNNNQKANFNDLNRQSTGIKNKLLHITKLIPQMVVENAKQPTTTFNSIFKLGDSLLLTAKDNFVSVTDVNLKQVTTEIVSDLGDLYFGSQDETRIIYLTNQNKITEYRTEDKKLEQRSIDWGAGVQIQIPLLYNNSIYLVDTANQTIYKYPAKGKDFGERQIWLKDKGGADLGQATAGAIDGNIWVGTANGAIYKFFTGKLENFAVKLIEPALGKIKKIFTTANLDNLYVLEDAGKRIVLFDKNGNFVGQFLFETIDEAINDFIVENGVVYFVSGNKSYQA